ncbi:hypothetical protein B0H16DRAFT_1512058 [Mycena metata]|uniref:Uncharacterized protein n=1 Tax=Mycena metata TaxID=1033252 RepID=A0AAD7K0V5_9AGAR|nr:hypothetical protein B0H16DRAFT_1512058 [Mycena metata]
MAALFSRAETGAPPYVAFDILIMLALVLLIAMLLPALLSRSVHRMKTWFNLVVVCIVYCISFLLLLGHQSGPEPPLQLCIFQAGLIYAGPTAVAAAGFVFVVELYLRLSSTLSASQVNERHVTVLLCISPLAHSIVFWVAIFTGISEGGSRVQRGPGGLYCDIASSTPTLTNGISVIVFVLMMIVVEIYTVVYLFRKRSALKVVEPVEGSFPLSLFIRTACYTLAGALSIILVVILNSPGSEKAIFESDFMAIIPLFVALVFGSQRDIIGVYMFWKKKNPNQIDKV